MNQQNTPMSQEQTTLYQVIPLLERISDALEKLAESITPNQQPPTFNQFNQDVSTLRGSLDTHPGEEPVDEDDENVIFADGRVLPKAVIEAMDDFERTWPGALPQENARAALAWHILQADQKHKKKVKDDSSGS
jgi:hypothetical protein